MFISTTKYLNRTHTSPQNFENVCENTMLEFQWMVHPFDRHWLSSKFVNPFPFFFFEIAYTLYLVYRCAELQRRWHPFYITLIENRMCKHSWSLKCCGETSIKKNCRQFLPTSRKCSLSAMVNFQKDCVIFGHLFQMAVFAESSKAELQLYTAY